MKSRRRTTWGILTGAALGLAAAVCPATTLDDVVAPGTRPDVLGTGYAFCEGPAADAEGNVYFSDGKHDTIHFHAPGKPVAVFANDSTDANGMMFNHRGELVVCEGAAYRVVAIDVKTKQKRVLASQVDGVHFNEPNDLAIDAQDGFYFTDPNYKHRGQETVMKEDVYYVSPQGKVTRVSSACKKPNGILLTPDGKILYLADNGSGLIYRYDVLGPGRLANETRWIDLGAGPDGMTLDQDGNLYVACGRAGIKVYSPQGKPIGVIEVPYASNCVFGGRDFKTLYVTSADKLLGVKTKVRGVLPPCAKAPAKEAGAAPARTHFSFEKRGKLISRPAGMPAPGPYYTCLVKMDQVERFPYEYALYFSTDHDRGKGGIWLYVGRGDPTDAASWKSYDQAVADGEFDYLPKKPGDNPIFVDSVQGRQTETPHANVIDGKVYMTYHNIGAGHGQSTLLATSPDGVNFARINGKNDSVVLDYDPKKEVGDGHTGYFRWRPNPFPDLHYKYVGYSLHGGGDDFHGAMWASNDAIHWDKVQVFDSIEGHAVDADRVARRRSIDPNSITDLGDGEFVAIGSLGHRSSGGRPRVLELYEIFLAGDGRALTRPCRKILANGPPGSCDAEELETPTTIVIGDTWHMIHVGTRNKAHENTVLGAVGKLDLSAPKPPALSPEDRTRDFH